MEKGEATEEMLTLEAGVVLAELRLGVGASALEERLLQDTQLQDNIKIRNTSPIAASSESLTPWFQDILSQRFLGNTCSITYTLPLECCCYAGANSVPQKLDLLIRRPLLRLMPHSQLLSE